MITTPEPSVKFDNDQDAALSEYQTRLATLESEIGIANKNLVVIKKDCDEVIKQRIEQEQIIADLANKTTAAQQTLNGLSDEIIDSKQILANLNSQIQASVAQQQIKNDDLNVREATIVAREKECDAKASELETKIAQVLLDKESVEKAKAAFLDAANTIVWK